MQTMLTNISWADYIAFISLLLIAYYLFIGIKFYSHDLKQLMAGKRKKSAHLATVENDRKGNENTNFQLQEIQPELFTSHQKYTPPIEEADDTFQQVEELML